jgi:hypothetical protein
MEIKRRERFDELLDKALRQYGNVEPRIGLETRILANIRAAVNRSHWRHTWLVAATLTAALVIAMATGIWHQVLTPKQNVPAPAVSQDAMKKVSSATIPRNARLVKPRTSRRPQRAVAGSRVSSTGNPRLARFPAPLPLSQEELLLARYAEHFPKEALLVAQKQRDFEEEIRQAELDAGAASTIPDQGR